MSLPSAKDQPRHQLPAPGVAFSLLSEAASHRAALASLEIAEARDHALQSCILAGISAALTLFTGFAVTLFAASLVWDSPNRTWWLAGLCTVYLATALATAFALFRRLRLWRPLDETQHQLNQDFQCLSQLIKSSIR